MAFNDFWCAGDDISTFFSVVFLLLLLLLVIILNSGAYK